MNDTSSSSIAVALNSCISCKQGKRKCNRVRPACATCSRVGRTCTYEEDNTSPARSNANSSLFSWPNPASASGTEFLSRVFSRHLNVDPFLHDALRGSTIDIGLRQETMNILGSIVDVKIMTEKYFATIWRRFPVMSSTLFRQDVATMYNEPKADFLVLCIAINLALQLPSLEYNNMQSSLYVTTKTSIALLEATGYVTMRMLQARLLVALYEMGHGLSTQASISVGGVARTVHALGLNRKHFEDVLPDDMRKLHAEQEKRGRWGAIVLDRFINLQDGYAIFATEDPKTTDHLPTNEETIILDSPYPDPPLTLATPSDQRVGPFARECQVTHLAGRVLKHVFEPCHDEDFHAQEALQLERTLLTFMPLLIEEGSEHTLYCAALGICTNALFTLYDHALATNPPPTPELRSQLLASIESCATRIFQFSAELFSDTDAINIETMSPFTAFSQYQAAIVQARMWKQTGEERYRDMGDSLRRVLGVFAKRWASARTYVLKLDAIMKEGSSVEIPTNRFF